MSDDPIEDVFARLHEAIEAFEAAISRPELVLMVNPADVDMPTIKAQAAQHGVTVVGVRFIRRGHAYLGRLPRMDT